MENDLVICTKLFSRSGAIGRRDFFLNFLYITMLSSPFWLPVLACLTIPKVLDIEWAVAIIGKLSSISIVIFSALLFPSLVKRLNDINGKFDKKLNTIYLSCFYVATLLTAFVSQPFFIVILGFLIYLFAKKGVISSKSPKDITKSFNWGAYFGTWLWGLFNKSYVTLWMIPLSITPLGFVFQLICGIKGNEWAAANKDWKSINHFKESQETQTIVFTILQLVIFPIVLTIIVFALMFGLMFKTFDESVKNPEKTKSSIEKIETVMSKIETLYFESHEITENENKFYISPNTWLYTSYKERTDILDLAANISASERRKNDKSGNCCSYSKSKELPRTKIYNVENNELLAEFYMDESLYTSEEVNFKDILKASFKAYRFYEPTEE